MSAKQGSGTILDFLKLFRDNHFSNSKNSNLSSGLSDSDTGYVVLSGLGDEDYTITANPSSEVLNVSVGYNANTSPSLGGDYEDGVIFSSDYDEFGDTYDTPMNWWRFEGGNYFWVVGTSNTFTSNDDERVLGVGQQIIDRYWPYHETYDSSRVATFLHSSDEDYYANTGGWSGGRQGGFARVDDMSRDTDVPMDYEQGASLLVGTQTTQNEWRATGNTAVMKWDEGPKIVGSVDAWGVDTSKDSETPSHTDSVDAGGRTYQYINPKTDSWNGGNKYFFRVDSQ